MTSDPAAILRARARALAAPLQGAADPGASLELLEFRVGRERYAVETKHVCEVHRVKQITPLPGMPPFVLGVINVRGRLVPVFDLKVIFELPEQAESDLHELVIVEGNGLELGIASDETLGVRRVPPDSLQGPLPTLAGVRADYLRGVTAERLAVLDVARLLANPAIVVHEDVETTRTESR